jgi:hypothetical protein
MIAHLLPQRQLDKEILHLTFGGVVDTCTEVFLHILLSTGKKSKPIKTQIELNNT